MANIPKDPVMLLSFVNTQLRDEDSNLEEFCKRFLVEKAEIVANLEKINYKYDGLWKWIAENG